jgi:glycogen operon protein
MANGEENRDGSNDNDSWNCGYEGETDDAEINSLRDRQIKNAAALLLLSRGIPMLLAGDEFGNTQFGNNNAYCQDNRISWLDWSNLAENSDIFEFFKTMIAFRAKHPVLRRSDFYTGQNSSGYPELSFHGTRPWEFDENAPFLSFGFMYAEPSADYGTDEDAFIYCAVNAYWEYMTFELPLIPEGMQWEIAAYSGDGKNADLAGTTALGTVELMPRSLMLLIGHRIKKRKRRRGRDEEVIAI